MQDRKPPAYLEYAANMLSDVRFRMMSLAERGLLFTARLECWQNGGLPANPSTLAKLLGFSLAEIEAALPVVMPFFAVENGLIVCPELNAYRSHVENIREKQRQGGIKGSDKTNSRPRGKPRSKPQQGIPATPTSTQASYPTSTPASLGRVVNPNVNPNVNVNPVSLGKEKKAFIDEMETAEAKAIEYERNAMNRKH